MNAAVAKRVRWSVKDYFRMSAAGLFDSRRVELIGGEIIEVPGQGTPHQASITKTSRVLLGAFGQADWVVIRGTLILSPFNAPDPDFHVFDVPAGTPDDQLPIPLLVIEVSDTTYRKDSGPKLPKKLAKRIAERDAAYLQKLRQRGSSGPKVGSQAPRRTGS